MKKQIITFEPMYALKQKVYFFNQGKIHEDFINKRLFKELSNGAKDITYSFKNNLACLPELLIFPDYKSLSKYMEENLIVKHSNKKS